MPLPRYATLMISLMLALLLAVPALAQGLGPERRPDGVPPPGLPVPPGPPVTPVSPERPETPETPETPQTPNRPVRPPIPDGPARPETPNRPVMPAIPEHPETPATPSFVRPPVAGCFELLPPNDPAAGDGSAFAACVLQSLSDVPGTTHAAAIVAAVGEGIASGFPDGTFRPGQRISRAQMATMLDAALDLEPSVSGELPPDVNSDSVHAPAIAAIWEAGITQGRPDGTFAPGESVSRGHLAAFLVNAGLVEDLTEAVELPPDVRGSVHEHAITLVIGNGIAGGFPDGTFRPQDPVSRGQAATMILGTVGSPLLEAEATS